MRNRKDIDDVLRDLYAIDPGLREHEAHIRTIVTDIVGSRPDTRFDAGFARELRSRLLAEAAKNAPIKKISLIDIITMKHMRYLVPGSAALLLLLAVALVSRIPGSRQQAPVVRSPEPESGVRITALSAEAFGPLDVTSIAQAQPRPEGGGGGLGLGAGSPAPVSDDQKMIVGPVDWATNYRFVYKGEPISAPETGVQVLRRVKGAGASGLAASLRDGSLGLADLGKFDGLNLLSFALAQDKEFGYWVNVDLNEGMISFSQYWQKWPHPEQGCRDEECFRSYRLSYDQVPADAELIAIADRFLADAGISKTPYGEPEVRNEWRLEYSRMPDKESSYVPESVSVTYPLVIDGKKVVEEGGVAGLTVNVSVRHKKVEGLWNLATNRYESSTYAAETDVERLLAVAEKGGVNVYQYEGAKVVDVAIGTPIVEYAKIWRPKDDGQSEDLLVPALVFPVLEPPQDQPYFRKYVIVPLAKDLLVPPDQSGPYPMPLIKSSTVR